MPEPLRLALLANRVGLERIDGAIDDAVAALGLDRADPEDLDDASGVVDVVVAEVSKSSTPVSHRSGIARGRGVPIVYVAADGATVAPAFSPVIRYPEDAPRAKVFYKIAKAVEQALVDAGPPKVSDTRDEAKSYRVGEVFDGLMFHTNDDNGFALVGDYGRKPAMLHVSAMSPRTKQRLHHGTLDPGDPIRVRVTGVNNAKGQVRLAEAIDDQLTADDRTSMTQLAHVLYAWSLVESALPDLTSGQLALHWGTDPGMRLDEFRFVRNRLAHGDLVDEGLLTRASKLAEDLIQMSDDDILDIEWTRGEIVEGIVSDSETIHGITPSLGVLCNALDDETADAWARGDDHGHEAPPFGPATQDACEDCLNVWRYLPRPE